MELVRCNVDGMLFAETAAVLGGFLFEEDCGGGEKSETWMFGIRANGGIYIYHIRIMVSLPC